MRKRTQRPILFTLVGALLLGAVGTSVGRADNDEIGQLERELDAAAMLADQFVMMMSEA